MSAAMSVFSRENNKPKHVGDIGQQDTRIVLAVIESVRLGGVPVRI
jgi:hypothetical protein